MTGSTNPDHFALTTSAGALLTASLSQDAIAAARAWRTWRAATDLDALPDGQYLLLPALYANLTRFNLAAEADPRIKGVYRRTWYANQHFIERVAAALAALSQANIPAVLSGAAAMQDRYGGPGERPIGPIELLVAPADVIRAAETLSHSGWQPVRTRELLASPEYRQWVHQALFRRPLLTADHHGDRHSVSLPEAEAGATLPTSAKTISDGLIIAWRVLPATPASRDAGRFNVLALDTRVTPARLRPEAQLILAGARAAEGGTGRLLALADAGMILRAPMPLDWELLVALARLLAAARPLATTLTLLATLAGSPVGAPVLGQLAQLSQNELPYERLDDTRGLTGRANYHLRRWRRIAYSQGTALTPLSLLRYLQAAAGVTRIYHLPARLLTA